MTHRRRALWPLSWLVVAGLVAAALAPATAAAADPVVYATVTGHAAGGSDNNKPEAWGDNCTKLDNGNLGATYLLTQSYDLVVVKAGSDQSATWPNTLFANASAGETVWPDSDGSGSGGPTADDKGISHIIFCGPVETTTTTQTTDTTETETTSTGTETDTSSTATETTDTTETETTSTGTETDTSSTATETTDTTETETTSTGTETDTSSTATETTDTTETETTSTGTESETSSTTTETTDVVTTTTSTGQELGVVGTPGVTPPPTDAASVSAPAGTDNGFRMVLLGLAMILAVVLLLQPKGSILRK